MGKKKICIIGGGSGGVGVALAAKKLNIDFILIEKSKQLGGTSTNGLVSNWAPAPSHPIMKELFDEMVSRSGVNAIKWNRYKPKNSRFPKGTWSIIDDEKQDLDHIWTTSTLEFKGNNLTDSKPSISAKEQWRAFIFDADTFDEAVKGLVNSESSIIMTETEFVDINDADDGTIKSIIVKDKYGKDQIISLDYFIDCTGDITLCRKLEEYCENPKNDQNNPKIETKIARDLNGISLCYKIKKVGNSEPRNLDVDVSNKNSECQIVEIGTDEYLINPLKLMDGNALFSKEYNGNRQSAYKDCVNKVLNHFQKLKENEHDGLFDQFEISEIAKMLGIRESYRIDAKKILTSSDCMTIISDDDRLTPFIALADHNFDIHSNRQTTKDLKVKGIYGIELDSLIPKGWNNVLVACRGGGFDHVAASSCRLERTMMWLGIAAAYAVFVANSKQSESLQDINSVDVAKEMGMTAIVKDYYSRMKNNEYYGLP